MAALTMVYFGDYVLSSGRERARKTLNFLFIITDDFSLKLTQIGSVQLPAGFKKSGI